MDAIPWCVIHVPSYVIHVTSPLLYAGFVRCLQYVPPIPSNKAMIWCRRVHNLNLSFLSALMFVLGFWGTSEEGKFRSVRSFLCGDYNNNWAMEISTTLFVWSKYIEWGDTLFLQLSARPISWLQYTHHMSTAILAYVGYHRQQISPVGFVFVGSNTLIHIPMYWYFAYPNGFLRKYRQMITVGQIVQHIFCLLVVLYIALIDDCEQAEYSHLMAGMLYTMYLVFFVLFYIRSYIDSLKQS